MLLVPAYITSWILSRMELSEAAATAAAAAIVVVVAWVSLGAGTTRGPTMKDAAPPR